MVTRLEGRLVSLAAFLILVSAPGSAFSATTILDAGETNLWALVRDWYPIPHFEIDSDFVVIDHSSPGSASVSASGAGITVPIGFGSASGSGTAGLESNVFSAHWSGQAHVNSSPNGWVYAQSHFCPPQDGPWCTNPLWFEVTAPTPFTLVARGTASGLTSGGGGGASFALARYSSMNGQYLETIVYDSVSADFPETSDSFERRLSTTLNPGFYSPAYQAIASAGAAGANGSASLDVVMTLSPTGDCSDGLDNDGDTLVDLDDSNCEDGTDTSEATPVPALGTAGRAVALTTLLLLTLHHLRARRRA